ncbi:MAG: acetate kinase [Tenericutes bacterium GWC2_34_14]|nr:MAG: acetate kinase [Tenericutes bacterium GWC2_34_14]OHE34439.1 MAG: acetate kinase [Tenericutes bacterium GWE2_34_108]OHE35795.1 MAG: acetate kinase [Tenericutes bacterium GWF1_35_14]OHE39118.1 MAG: acetate kinase [Tenericutes bacterium GWF2_35_184]OHE42815.1 MAG: acetate kinase [Tenericutes bacterium RIFOXYA2_FULL_36_32]OHE46043.1 MAG: acetate kinase [Tenericutes bacterium RIFOXYB2_FULL_36_25]OHE47041.1 MAG: acetate kinase [Tenericutes bacterium RIFOXYA12_FULL_35_10]OHE49998.1 MAG: ace
MLKILAVNAGSSSLKFQLFEMPEEKTIVSGIVERIGYDNAAIIFKYDGQKFVENHQILNHKVAVDMVIHGLLDRKIIESLDEIKGVGHRVVQGGELFKESAIIDDTVIEKIASLNDLAPLHNPANLTGIHAFQAALPNVIQVAVFDTTFHQTMTEDAYLYAAPYEWYEKYGVRKYGFHGTSHQYVSQRAAELLGNPHAKIVVAHLGNGASLCAVKDGISVDTSMGLTPLEGIPMGTRSGNIDPAVLMLVSSKEDKTYGEVLDELNKKSGYLGLSGFSNDSRDIIDGMNRGEYRATLAHKIQVKRIVDYIGSYYVYMGGLDALCFTAGIGENAPEVRRDVIKGIKVLGIELDEVENEKRGERMISTKDSKVKAFIIPTNEEVMIAREVTRLK